jgi:hypothetical protein
LWTRFFVQPSAQLRPGVLFIAFEFTEIRHYALTGTAGCAIGFDQRPVCVLLAVW